MFAAFLLFFVLCSCGMQLRDEEFILSPLASCRPCDPCFENTYFAQDGSVGPGPIGVEQKHTILGLDNYATASGCSGAGLFQFYGLASGNGKVDVPWTAAKYDAPSSKEELMQLVVDALNTTETACYSLIVSGTDPKIRAEYRSGNQFGINIFERFPDCGDVALTDGWSFGVSGDGFSAYDCTEAGDDAEEPYNTGNCSFLSAVSHGSL